MTEPRLTRRPLTSRNTNWARASARWLARVGMRPNQISLLSLVFATSAGLTLVGAGVVESRWRAAVFLAAAAFIQLRLLCNLFDGMVALEGGFDRGVKDFGAMIEGHGGVMDRIDSICFAAPVLFHLTRYFFT